MWRCAEFERVEQESEAVLGGRFVDADASVEFLSPMLPVAVYAQYPQASVVCEVASQEAQAKKENCARAQEYVRTIESGQRISRTDAKGERYFLEDAQIAQEAARARQAVQQWCN